MVIEEDGVGGGGGCGGGRGDGVLVCVLGGRDTDSVGGETKW